MGVCFDPLISASDWLVERESTRLEGISFMLAAPETEEQRHNALLFAEL
jgi:hypothetical protein